MKIEKWTDDRITFSDGSMITYDHRRDCCESNYADFSVLDIFYNGEEFSDYWIEPVTYGVNLVLVFSYWKMKKIYIPFYSEQNGYYTSELCLIVKDKDTVAIGEMDAYWVPDKPGNGLEKHVSESMAESDLDFYSAVVCKLCGKLALCRGQQDAMAMAKHHMTVPHSNVTWDEVKKKAFEGRTPVLNVNATSVTRLNTLYIIDACEHEDDAQASDR